MRIIINHLTRMSSPYICVAGLDNDESHIRPVTVGQLHRNLLRSRGGIFEIGAEIEIGAVVDVSSPPEMEDRRFDPANARRIRSLSENNFWGKLLASAQDSLIDLFGEDLTKRGSTSCAVDLNHGAASLGCLSPQQQPTIYRRRRPGKPDDIRLTLTDPDLDDLDLAVTDIRFYGQDHVTPDFDVAESVNDRLEEGVPAILSVGLTRPFPRENPLHWLQINNVHLEDDPLWNLG